MVSSSTYYNLTLYDSSDTTELFLNYRLDMCGTTNSNMTKIDTALNDIQTQLSAISGGAVPVNATFSSGSLYEATGITEITAYETDLQIILRLNQTSNGTVTLNINSLGIRTVYKIDNAGSVRNIDGNELGINKEYYLRYNGTAWIVISAIQNTAVMRKNIEALSTTKTLTDYDEPIQYLDPNGANRDVLLPAESVWNPIFIIYNSADADEDLSVKEDGAVTTIATVAQGQVGYFFSSGSVWKGFVSETAYTVGDLAYAVSTTEIGTLPIGSPYEVLAVNATGNGLEWTAGGSNSFTFNETPSGTINGSNTSFTLAGTPTSGTLMLFRDGQLLLAGASNDYTISGTTITMAVAPVTGSVLTAFYQENVVTTGNADTVDGLHASELTQNADTDVSGNSWVLDEDDMVSNDATKVPTQQSVKQFVANSMLGLSHNLIKNYPSLELANGTAPLWWSATNATLTEEDATGEGLSNSPNERVLKVVTTDVNGLIFQPLTYADERLLYDGISHSGGVWVYNNTAGTISASLAGTGGSWVTSTTTLTGQWVYLQMLNRQTSGSTIAQFRVSHSANGATFYIANPVLNTGSVVAPFKPRGLVYRDVFSNFYSADPGGVGYQDHDITSTTSANAVLAQIKVNYLNTTTVNRVIKLRRKGDTGDTIAHEVVRNVNTTSTFHAGSKTIQLDDTNTFQSSSSAPAGDVETLSLSVAGYWEWE